MLPQVLSEFLFGHENSMDSVTWCTLCAQSESSFPYIAYRQTSSTEGFNCY